MRNTQNVNHAAIPSLCSMAPRKANWSWAACRGVVFVFLFSLIFLPEFRQDGWGDIASSLYAKVDGRFRLIDVLLASLIVLHVLGLACSRTRHLHFPRNLTLPGMGFLAALAGGIVYGTMRGSTNLFFDWRSLALGIGLYFVWSFWIQTAADLHTAVTLFAGYMAIRILVLYGLYLAGSGEILQGVRIPTFDGPTISAIVFTALLCLSYHNSALGKRQKLVWLAVAGAACVMVLLCFRRTYWAELAVGAAILLLLQRRHRGRSLLKLAVIVGLAVAILGPLFFSRMRSFNFAQTSSQFSDDNTDHVDDILDAWDQVQQAPLLGVGVGTPYPTWRIRNWKSESVMVHNAALHVWLKCGITGLVFYLWFHIALLSGLKARAVAPTQGTAAFLAAALAYLSAKFVTSLGFAPWPYSELQLTALISFLFACIAIGAAGNRLAPQSFIPYSRTAGAIAS